MSSKTTKSRKHTREQLELLTTQQLVALAVQRGVLTYEVSRFTGKAKLIESLVDTEDVLVPVPA
jgi:hypothetical protein